MSGIIHRALIVCMFLLIRVGAVGVPSAYSDERSSSPEQQPTFPPCTFQASVYSMAVSHSNQWVLAGLLNGEVRLWNIETGEVIRTFQQRKQAPITDVAFSPDDHLIATADSSSAKVWKVADGSLLWEFPRRLVSDYATYIDFLPNGNQLMVSGADGASIWNLITGEEIYFFPGSEVEQGFGAAPQLSPDGHYVTTRKFDTAEVSVWDAVTGTLALHFTNARRSQMPISFVSSSEVAFNEKEALTLWDIQSGQQTGRLELGEGFTEEWRFSPNGNYALIFRDIGQTGYEYTTDLWNIDSRQKIYSFDPFLLRNSLFLPDGDNLLIVAPDKDQQALQASIWNIPSHSVVRTFPVDSEVITSASTHNGRYWITSTEDYHVSVWDLQTGQRTKLLC